MSAGVRDPSGNVLAAGAGRSSADSLVASGTTLLATPEMPGVWPSWAPAGKESRPYGTLERPLPRVVRQCRTTCAVRPAHAALPLRHVSTRAGKVPQNDPCNAGTHASFVPRNTPPAYYGYLRQSRSWERPRSDGPRTSYGVHYTGNAPRQTTRVTARLTFRTPDAREARSPSGLCDTPRITRLE